MEKKRMGTTKKEKKKKLSFFDLIEQRILYFNRFRGNQGIAVEDLTVGLMKNFRSYLVDEGLNMNAISLYNWELRAVYNYVLDGEIIRINKRPFRKVVTGMEKTHKRVFGKEPMKRITQLADVDKNL